MAKFWIERDTFGDIKVPAERLWGAQTQRSLVNFKFPGETMPLAVVHEVRRMRVVVAQDPRATRVRHLRGQHPFHRLPRGGGTRPSQSVQSEPQ